MRRALPACLLLATLLGADEVAPPVLVSALRLGEAGADWLEDAVIADDGTIYVVGTLAAPRAGATTLGEDLPESAYGWGFVVGRSLPQPAGRWRGGPRPPPAAWPTPPTVPDDPRPAGPAGDGYLLVFDLPGA